MKNKKNKNNFYNLFDPSDIQETFYNDYFIKELPSYKKLKNLSNRNEQEIISDYFVNNYYPYKNRLDLKNYYKYKIPLQVELVKMQNSIKNKNEKLLILFEGRDAAGKGATIRRFMEHLNPRGAKVVALEKPTDIEQKQWYFQRYINHFPSAGEIILFDRSWYNRAGVEIVMGFCTNSQYKQFLIDTPKLEKMITDSGIKLIKLYFSVSDKEQITRLKQRESNPLKNWKLSELDYISNQKWPEYTSAKEIMFKKTHKKFSPWWVIKSDDKMRARINAMRLVLNLIDYDDKDNKITSNIDKNIVRNAEEIIPFI